MKPPSLPTHLLRRGRTSKPACSPRPDGATIHRTKPLEHPRTGKLIGHSCPCGEIFTPAGNQSRVSRPPVGEAKPTKAHAARTVAHVMGRR